MRGALTVIVVVLAASVAAGAWAIPPGDGVLRYAVRRNGSRLGDHVVRFRHRGAELEVVHAVRVLVRVLFVTAYRYDSDRTETWQHDRLVGLRARTNDNGDRVDVSVRRVAQGLLVRDKEGRSSTVPPDVVVAGPAWNVLTRRRPSRMIDDSTGRVLRVSVSAPASVKLRLGTRRIPCTRYHVSGELDATYWYRADGALVQERLRAPDDSEVWTVLR